MSMYKFDVYKEVFSLFQYFVVGRSVFINMFHFFSTAAENAVFLSIIKLINVVQMICYLLGNLGTCEFSSITCLLLTQ